MQHAPVLVVAVDLGALSCRSDRAVGAEPGSSVSGYPPAEVDYPLPSTGLVRPPDRALQVPSAGAEELLNAVPAAVDAAGATPAHVIGIYQLPGDETRGAQRAAHAEAARR